MERNAERTRTNIMQAAIREFSDKGFAGARVDCIADAAGCNKGMIYQYYGSKEHLYAHSGRTGQPQRERRRPG